MRKGMIFMFLCICIVMVIALRGFLKAPVSSKWEEWQKEDSVSKNTEVIDEVYETEQITESQLDEDNTPGMIFENAEELLDLFNNDGSLMGALQTEISAYLRGKGVETKKIVLDPEYTTDQTTGTCTIKAKADTGEEITIIYNVKYERFLIQE